MHVLMTADTIGGVWNYARELATGLSQRGVRITLVSFGEIPSTEQTQWMEGLSRFDYRPTGFKLEWMRDSMEDLEHSSEYLQSLIDEVQPDVLHFNQYFYGALHSSVPKIVCAHSDVIGWWQAVRGSDPPSSSWIDEYRQLVYSGLAAADTVVAPSRWMLESLSENYLEPVAGRVIYNGRTPTLFNPHVSKEEFVMSVGRVWDAGKQVTLLAQQELPCETFLVGSAQDPDGNSQLTLFEASGERKVNINFKGPQTEAQLRQLYGRCSIYAATSRYEPFGLAPWKQLFPVAPWSRMTFPRFARFGATPLSISITTMLVRWASLSAPFLPTPIFVAITATARCAVRSRTTPPPDVR